MPLAIVLTILVVGSLIFHFLSPWTFTPIASNWGMIDTTISITVAVTGIVFIAVNLFMIYAIIRYRHKEGARAKYEPENKKLEVWLTVITTIGISAMLAPGLFVYSTLVTVPEEAIEIEVVGQQWDFSFRHPGKDGQFGKVDTKLIRVENSFGIDPDDPNGHDDVLIDDAIMHIPVGKPVQFWMRSKDVLHNFAVPQFRIKMDLVPGLESYMWLEPTKIGEYEILCEELCGIAHHAMRGRIVVEAPEDYQAWLDSQLTYAEIQARGSGNPMLGTASYTMCAACHGTQGEGQMVLNSPKLSGQDPQYLKKQLQKYKAGIRGTNEADIYGRQMQPMAATLINDVMIDNVVAHIGTLPDIPAPTTINGDIVRGAKLYVICANCHGKDGDGIKMNAPPLAGMSDWYLLNQLKHFKQGIRGEHPYDLNGKQMGYMARILQDEQAMRDVVAYINTL